MKLETEEPTHQSVREHDDGSPIDHADTGASEEARTPAGNRRRGSIRLRLASLVVACVLPVWIAAGFLVYYNYQSKRALTEQHMLDTARALTLVVDRELANMQASLTVLATTPSLVSGDLPRLLPSGVGGSGRLSRRVHYPCRRVRTAARQYVSSIWRALAQAQRAGSSSPGLCDRQAADHQRLQRGFVRAPPNQCGCPSVPRRPGRLRLSHDYPCGPLRHGSLAAAPPAGMDWKNLRRQSSPGCPDSFTGGVCRPDRPVSDLGQRMRDAAEGTAEAINFEGVRLFNSFSRSATSGWTVVIGVPKDNHDGRDSALALVDRCWHGSVIAHWHRAGSAHGATHRWLDPGSDSPGPRLRARRTGGYWESRTRGNQRGR